MTEKTNATKLLEEAVKLAKELDDALNEIPELWQDVQSIIRTAELASAQPRSRELFSAIRSKHQLMSNALEQHPKAISGILQRYRQTNIYEALEKYRELLSCADVNKLADAELLRLLQRAGDNVLSTPERMISQYASVQIQVFVLALAYYDVLCAFLQRPTKFGAVVNGAISLLKAAAEDLASSAIPVLSTIKALVEVSKPRIELEIEQIKKATSDLDRIFKLDASFDELLDFSSFVGASVLRAEEATQRAEATFQNDITWLFKTLGSRKSS